MNRIRELGRLLTTVDARHRYLARWVPSYPAYRLLNDRHGPRYRSTSSTTKGIAYFADGTFMGDWFGPARYSRVTDKLAEPPALYRELKLMGADHFLIWVDRHGGSTKAPNDSFFSAHFKVLYWQGPIVLFAIAD